MPMGKAHGPAPQSRPPSGGFHSAVVRGAPALGTTVLQGHGGKQSMSLSSRTSSSREDMADGVLLQQGTPGWGGREEKG